jgi:hypothetical protein
MSTLKTSLYVNRKRLNFKVDIGAPQKLCRPNAFSVDIKQYSMSNLKPNSFSVDIKRDFRVDLNNYNQNLIVTSLSI